MGKNLGFVRDLLSLLLKPAPTLCEVLEASDYQVIKKYSKPKKAFNKPS